MKRLIGMLLVATLLFSTLMMSACSSDDAADGGVTVITIPHYKVGENVGAVLFLPQVERFNELYAGQYEVVVEEVPQDMYSERMKQLALQDMLPPLVEGVLDEVWLFEDLIPNNKITDLGPYLAETPELREVLLDIHLEYNTRDGKLLTINTPIIRPTVLYYNETLYQPVKPIADMDWDELVADLGDEKIAFMTTENAWTTMIPLTSMVAVEPGGVDLLYDHLPADNKLDDFNNPIMISAFDTLQRVMQAASSSNTIGATYADAANAFMSNNAAIIGNGSWMVGDFAEDSADKWSNDFNGSMVRAAALPGNVGLDGDVLGFGWWIPTSASPEEAEAAWAFISFMNTPAELEESMLLLGGSSPNITPSAEFLARRDENKLLSEYMDAVDADSIIVPYLWNSTAASIADPEFGKLLPKLVDGSLTAEEFAAELTRVAAETAN